MQQLQTNKDALLRIMTSPDGKKLMEMMNRQSGSAALKHAAGSAVKGDTNDIARMVQNLMSNPEGAALVQRINDAMK